MAPMTEKMATAPPPPEAPAPKEDPAKPKLRRTVSVDPEMIGGQNNAANNKQEVVADFGK